jgi:molecular chaperone GrpE (heat shock protein)
MLGYRSTFTIDLDRTTATDRQHMVDVVLAEGFHWLHTQKHLDDIDSLKPGHTYRFSSGHEVTFIRGTTDSGTLYAKLVALDPPRIVQSKSNRSGHVDASSVASERPSDEPNGRSSSLVTEAAPARPSRRRSVPPHRSDTDEHWTTTLLVGLDLRDPRARPMVDIEVDAPRDPTRFGIDGARFTSRPKLATNILGAFTCDDHGFEVAERPRVIFAEDVDELLRQLSETDHHSLVFLSGTDASVPAGVWSTRLEEVTRETVGQAAVFVLDRHATAAFNTRVSLAHAVQPYGLRIFCPGAVIDDLEDGRRHRSVSPKTLLNAQVRSLRDSFGRLCREHANATPPDRFLRRLDVITGLRLDQVTGISGSGAALVAPTRPGPVPPSPALDEGELLVVEPDIHAEDADNQRAETTLPDLPTRLPTSASDKADRHPEADKNPSTEQDALAHSLEISELQTQNASLRAKLDQVQAAHRDLRARLAEAQAQIRVIQKKGEDDAVDVADEYEKAVAQLRQDLDDRIMENAAITEDSRTLQDKLRTVTYQLEQARQRLRDQSLDPSTSFEEPAASPYGEPLDSWEDLQYLSSEVFPHLRFGDDCWKAAMELAPSDPLGQWARLTWDALVILDEYATTRVARNCPFTGGLREYLEGKAPAGAHLIPAGRLRASESETVKGRKNWLRERQFSVPTDIDPSGEEEMLSHIAIQTKGSISPRLYFDDRAADRGVVVIGYIGPHLTNTKTRS